ncbi:MAG: hypothetical protein ACRDWT_07910 [Jatrophihabitantaceae bacterium]
MNSALSGIPIPRRRGLAATLGLFAVLFIAVGAVAATGGGALRVFSALALAMALALALIGWGVLHSIRIDTAEARLDAAIEDAISSGGPELACGCGHDHDPDELHVTDGCARDGHGADCRHNCDLCLLAALRPSPTTPRSERMLGQ